MMSLSDVPCEINELLSITGNDSCMECDSNTVEWASINLGIFLCESCSGRHRELGVHISRVKSLKLDTKIWNKKSLIRDIKLKGNINAKYYFESRVPLYTVKPPNDCGPIVVQDWITNKYEKKIFIDPNNANNIYSDKTNNTDNDENKLNETNIANLNFALHKMPCSPIHAMLKWIVPNDNDNKHQIKQQFIVLHGRWISRYNTASSNIASQIIDITKQPIWISESYINRPCILAIGPQKMNQGMRLQFDQYNDIKYWTELLRRSSLFYQELGHNICAAKLNDTVNSLLSCSISDLDNTSIYKHLKYGYIKKQHKFSIGWDKKWWTINLKRKILIYFTKDPRTMKANKKNPFFIEAQGGYYINEIIGDIDNNGYRSGQEHCLLLYHFEKTIFIKFDQLINLIQFWKELHIKPKDVKYIGKKPIFYEKALCQQNVDVQVMVLKQQNSNKQQQQEKQEKKQEKQEKQEKQHQIIVNQSDFDINSQTDDAMIGSPPPPQTYTDHQTINGVGIGTAILNHEMLMDEQIITINDINNNNRNNNKYRESITDFNQRDLLHNPIPNKYKKQKSNLQMLMDLHIESNGNHHIQNDTNLSDEEDDDYDFEVDEDLSEIIEKTNKSRLESFDNPRTYKKTSNTYDDEVSLNDEFGVFDYEKTYNHKQSVIESPLKHLQQNQNQNQDPNININMIGSPDVPIQHLEEEEFERDFPSPNNTQTVVHKHIANNIKPISPQNIEKQKKSPIIIRQSVSESSSAPELSGGSDDEFDVDIDINNNDNNNNNNNDNEAMPDPVQGRLRAKVGSTSLQYFADNSPMLPPDDDNDNGSPSNEMVQCHPSKTIPKGYTLTDPPSNFSNDCDIKHVANDINCDDDIPPFPPHQISTFSGDGDGNLSEEEDVMYKDHRRGTVEQYAEKNKFKSRTYRNFAKSKVKNNVNIMNGVKEEENDDDDTKTDNNDNITTTTTTTTTSKLPAPPPKRKKKGNELMREYLLNTIQIRKLNDTDMMQQIMIQCGNMASFFVQPGNKLFVRLHGAVPPSVNINQSASYNGDNYNTDQIWQYIENLLIERIGHLNRIK